MKTIIVWFRNDLRMHDHPALSASVQDAAQVVPFFVLSDELLKAGSASSNRNRFLLECLEDLKKSLRAKGADLVIRSGDPAEELKKIASETDAEAVYYTADYTPYSIKRDKRVKTVLEKAKVEFRGFPGRLAVSSLDKLQTKSGTTFKVFTPFWKSWLDVQHRKLAKAPKHIKLPSSLKIGELPKLSSLTNKADLSPEVIKGGETEGRKRLKKFLESDIEQYHQGQNDMADDSTSRLSPYLHFGCLSPREIEDLLPDSKGARAWQRQLCWREFYYYIIYKFPQNVSREFQERYRSLKWRNSPKLLQAWQTGQTGYPAVDAGMRQLNREGWMHNRARLITGSFLTKDLWLDWRQGEHYFYKMLLDGDVANNNGNWQWIASVGVDPAPVYRRLYNPSLQRDKFDPTGGYVRRYVPELKHVPDKYLSQPWTMPEDTQKEAGCIIGKDYPKPVVDHAESRAAALEYYRAAQA